MSDSFIMQMRPWFGEEEKKAVCDYMDEDGFITEFKRTEQFEQMIADYTQAKHCIVVNNGTVSLTLAALAVGVEAGDEVIVPNFTMIASANSVKMFGAQPVFVDVEPESLVLDIEKVKAAITDKTKAILLVSVNGRYPTSGIEAFRQLADEKGLKLIEDAAQSLGSRYPDGRHMGTVGDVGSFSFSAPKIISTGQGGCVITNDDAIATKLRKLKDFGRSGGGNDIHDEIGFNFKFTELQACIGIEQMKKLPWRVERKKDILRRYQDNLKGCEQVTFFEQDLENTTPWFIDVTVQNRTELQAFLKEKGIGTRVMYPPINKQAAYNYPGEHQVSNFIGEQGLWLPSQTQLEDAQIDYICDAIKEFYNK
ncbi:MULTISPECIES: DegT/DnrJ/EryC1/StrS family aminotransferase [unclassified Pseudoalteromonas]|uniref:DegT/DnrJ/EryC1/StrS family aminotransferase n=1 Tax=unclassified Pseudoalteromonas TaxID=194690 RepID=UPI002097D64A|nr:DegT/DnrJ/EryC1/StrS family aminotransferase [Pseudoalteromonas sp. XMcav2-N]MCO7188749.1 DegT/DnrJ/EryC1/StrS family aminotransferase [Pseudoalteromonas sp. XMcav2-N]